MNYLSSSKRVVPYEMIARYDSLDTALKKDAFFLPYQFYSSLKDKVISRQDYEAVKKLYCTMSLENIGELDKLYIFQDTIILTEIFEQRPYDIQKLFKFNPKKSNSASSFSGCVHRYKSKCLIASPTEAKHVKLFEKTLIGGFSCVNTRLGFDLELLLPKNERDKYKLI